MRHWCLVFCLVASGCHSIYAPAPGVSVVELEIRNLSNSNVSLGTYGDPIACTSSVWLTEKWRLSPGEVRKVSIEAGKLATILFTAGEVKTLANDGVQRTLQIGWCYSALTFNPANGNKYRFNYDTTATECRVSTQVLSSAGEWETDKSVRQRDTSAFTLTSVSPCKDVI